MRQEQREAGDLGAFGIIRESFKVFWIHPKPFLLILLTFILPVAILEQVFVYFGHTLPSPFNRSPTGHVFSAYNGSDGVKLESVDLSSVLGLIGWVCIVVALQIAQALSISAVLYAVGLIYTGKTVSFHDVVRAAVPRLWLRLSVTSLYTALIMYSSFAIAIGVSLLLVTQRGELDDDYDYNFAVMVWVVAVAVAVLTVGEICLAMIFIVASGVSVLEEAYGCAAFAKGYKLLQGKKWVVLKFYLLSTWPVIITIFLPQSLLSPNVHSDSTWTKLVLVVILCSAWTSIYMLFLQLCNSVMYVSCKASHNESIEDSYLFDDRGGYEGIENSQA